MDPVLGTDVIIQFRKNDMYLNYACATDIRIDFEMETKSVKTVGDGNWKRVRGQGKSAVVSLSGLAKFDDDAVPHVFDLWDYFDAMTDIDFRMYFTMEDGITVKIFEGTSLPTTWGLGGGSEGFASGDTRLEVNGTPQLKNAVVLCEAEITGATLVGVNGLNALRIDSLLNGPITRYDWEIVSAPGRQSAFVDGTLPDTFVFGNGAGAVGATETLRVWPICDNGEDGELFTIEFENLPA